MSDVDDLITSALHARTMAESLLHGCDARIDRIKGAITELDRLGSSPSAVFALRCAIGAEQDTQQAMGKAVILLTQEVGHLEAAKQPPTAG